MSNLNLLLPGCNLKYNILNKNPFTAAYITGCMVRKLSGVKG